MTYIIENATISRDNDLKTTSLLIQDNKIAFIGNNVKKYSYMRTNADSYILSPTFVIFDSLSDMDRSFQQKKEYFTQNFILKGCTTILTYVDVKYENELISKMKTMKLELLSSPIDYCLGVKVPLSLLTPNFIRKCKREKIPAVFIDLQNNDNLSEVPWGWIREAMFPYNSALIPITSNLDNRNDKRLLSEWKTILTTQKIQHFDEPLSEKKPIIMSHLSKIGIYPLKACLMQGCEVSYNLYLKNREMKNVDVESLYQYHQDKLAATIHKGIVIRAGAGDIHYRSGYGEHVTVKVPAYFSII
jgi:hypothetical protein